MEAAWYFRLFYVNIIWFVIAWLLSAIIGAKRMRGPGPGRLWAMLFGASIIAGWVLTWFITFRIGPAFWVGAGIIVSGEIIFALGYAAMREHPEKKAVVDWGIYGISRHPHVLAGIICLIGLAVMGWNPQSGVYTVLWVYFVLHLVLSHFMVENEERLNVERFGQEYKDYTGRVPRYFLIKG